MKKLISFLICISLTACIFTGCSKSKEKIDLIYPFSGNVNSYDPQVAATQDEFLIAENCFEGLVRCDDEGNITPGCAESWQVSEDGLSYTFKLKQGLRWYIFPSVKKAMGEDYNPEITAEDFVFGLQRAADDLTQSPLFATISAIENANEIHSGYKDESELGVYASDKYTLQINLAAADDDFLQTLSTAVAMPCNREFFNSTNGRYGLDLKYTMFNGQFVLTSVLETSYIMKANTAYAGPSPAKASDLTLKIVGSDESVADKLVSGYYDAAYLRGYESDKAGKKSGITLVPYSNTTWSLIINTSKGVFAKKDARKAFALSLSEIDYKEYDYLSSPKGYVPPSCTAGGKSYTEQCAATVDAKDKEEAIELWKKALKDSGTYSMSVTVLAPETMKDAAKELIQGIQSGIGTVSKVGNHDTEFSLKLETAAESEVKTKAASGDYDIVLYPLVSNSASPITFLNDIDSLKITDFYKNDFEKALEEANAADSASLVSACEECEAALYDTYCFIPVFYESNYYTQAKGVSGVQFHPGSGRVSFINATRS